MGLLQGLHLAGWSTVQDEAKEIHLKRAILGYARYNKTVGYSQGLNIITALVSEVVNFKEEPTLKVVYQKN